MHMGQCRQNQVFLLNKTHGLIRLRSRSNVKFKVRFVLRKAYKHHHTFGVDLYLFGKRHDALSHLLIDADTFWTRLLRRVSVSHIWEESTVCQDWPDDTVQHIIGAPSMEIAAP